MGHKKHVNDFIKGLLKDTGMEDTPANRMHVMMQVFSTQQATIVCLLTAFKADIPKPLLDHIYAHFFKRVADAEGLPGNVDGEHICAVLRSAMKAQAEHGPHAITARTIKDSAFFNLERVAQSATALLLATSHKTVRDPVNGVEVDEAFLNEVEALTKKQATDPALFTADQCMQMRVQAKTLVLRARKMEKEKAHGGAG